MSLQRLQHGGPGLEPLGVEFVIFHRLLDEVPAGLVQAVEARGVGVFGGGLLCDAAAIFGPVEVGGAERAEFLVRGVELLFALVGFLRGLEPLAELCREPERVVSLVEDVENECGRADVRPAGQVIDHPRAQLDGLRCHALARRAEGADGTELLHFVRARGDDFLAGDRCLAVGLRLVADPRQAGFLDAEIIRRGEVEGDDLGIEHDFLERIAPRHDGRRLVDAGLDLEHERVARREAVLVGPVERAIDILRDRLVAGHDFAAVDFLRLAVERGGLDVANGFGLEGGLRSLQDVDGSVAHLERRLGLVAEVVRQFEADLDAGQLRPCFGVDLDTLAHVAERQGERAVLLLRREEKGIGARREVRLDLGLVADAAEAFARRPLGVWAGVLPADERARRTARRCWRAAAQCRRR